MRLYFFSGIHNLCNCFFYESVLTFLSYDARIAESAVLPPHRVRPSVRLSVWLSVVHVSRNLSVHYFCMSNPLCNACMHLCICIGQTIKSRKRPSVRLSTRRRYVDKITTLCMDRSSPNLEHSFSVSYRSKDFCAFPSEVVHAHARSLIDRHLQLSSFCTND